MIDEASIKQVVEKVVEKLVREGAMPVTDRSGDNILKEGLTGLGRFNDVNTAIEVTKHAQKQYAAQGMEQRRKVIAALREALNAQKDELGAMAVEETGLGRMPDKAMKIELAINKTPGVEDLVSSAYSGDRGLTLVELAPFGVIGAITPSTNPAETVINNGIGAIAAGNGIVINPHPAAKKVSAKTVEIMNKAIIAAGSPANLISIVGEPTLESAQSLMTHKDIGLLLVTGGGEVVKLAMRSGKKAICGGPGNPPVIVDETADLEKAAKDIVFGASFDHNVLCIAEKEVFVVEKVADTLIKNMQAEGAYLIKGDELAKLMKLMVVKDEGRGVRHPHLNRDWVGKSAISMLRHIGVNVSNDIKLIIFEAQWDHPFVVGEQLRPILPIVRVKDVDTAMDLAVQVEHGYGHTFMMHSRNVASLSKMASMCKAAIFVKNAPSIAGLGAGGEGCTTFTIASPTGEGITTAKNFTKSRRCVLVDYFRII